MTKETLLEILKLSEEKCIPEKDAAFEIVGKRMCLNHYKRKYGLKTYMPGESKHSHGQRKHKVNDDYFGTYTLENCYYAGFIAADGNINKKQNKLTIGLSIKDKDFLVKFLENIESDYKVHTGMTREVFGYASVVVLSPKMCEDLEQNFNITPHKSFSLLPPNITDKQMLDSFIIGLIDGDGTISYTKKKLKDGRCSDRFYISLIGTEEIITIVKNRFEEILGHKTSNLHNKKEHTGNTYTIRVSDKSARTLFEHFYGFNVPKLDRKWKPEYHEYCLNFKKKLPLCRRKGVNVFGLDGKFISHFDTLNDAAEFTQASIGHISRLCKINNNEHMANGYMFSRTKTEMESYVVVNPFSKKRLKELENLK